MKLPHPWPLLPLCSRWCVPRASGLSPGVPDGLEHARSPTATEERKGSHRKANLP